MNSSNNEKKISSALSLGNIMVPLSIGFISLYFVLVHQLGIQHFSFDSFRQLKLGPIFLAFIFIIIRDFAFIVRLRIIVGNQITWKKSFYIISLWDFVSAITPSVAGGGLVAMYLLMKENIPLGKAVALIFLTTILDNFVFLSISPVGLWTLYQNKGLNCVVLPGHFEFKSLLLIGIIVVFLYTLLILVALFINPNFINYFAIFIGKKIKFFSSLSSKIVEQVYNLKLASTELNKKKTKFWVTVIFFSFVAILSRYAILNSLICSSKNVNFFENVLIFGNQIFLWVVMLLSPTPGSAGTAEFFFSNLYADLLGDNLAIIEILWRILTYYLHIVIGALFIIFNKKNKVLPQQR